MNENELSPAHKVAIVAGAGELPLQACSYFLAHKIPFFILALFPEDNGIALTEGLPATIDIIHEKYYKPGTILELFKQKNASHILFAGKVDKQNLFKKIKFDWFALSFLARLSTKSDKQIMEAVLEELHKHSFTVLHQSTILASLFIPPGIINGTLMQSAQNDIELGMSMAQKLSEIEVGQTVVVKEGVVLALEALEGTDACIKRGVELGQGNVIVCKAARHDHNKKYDLPTLGPSTLISFDKGDIAILAWQSKHTLIIHKEEFLAQACLKQITLVSL